MGEKLSKTLAQNKQVLEAQFGGTVDLYMKDVQLCGIPCCICMFEGLSSIERLWIMMLDSLSKPQVMPRDGKELLAFLHDRTAIPLESNILSTFEEVRTQLTAGTSVILIDGAAQALVLSTQSMQFRSVSEPSGENNLRGSREGFVELLRVNISLVRRLVRTETFMAETLTCGEKTQTELALLYDRKLVSQPLLDEIRRRASQARLPFLFDTGYLAPFLQRGYFSFFQSVGYTERPDTAAAKICEGKIVLMANGSPFAMLIPYFFSENFSSMDDYSEKAYFATLVRCLKYAAFLIAVMLQGVFVSIANFTPELLPKEMLYKIAASEQATPLPLFLEAILVTFLLEIVREAGLRPSKTYRPFCQPCGGAYCGGHCGVGRACGHACCHCGGAYGHLYLCGAFSVRAHYRAAPFIHSGGRASGPAGHCRHVFLHAGVGQRHACVRHPVSCAYCALYRRFSA